MILQISHTCSLLLCMWRTNRKSRWDECIQCQCMPSHSKRSVNILIWRPNFLNWLEHQGGIFVICKSLFSYITRFMLMQCNVDLWLFLFISCLTFLIRKSSQYCWDILSLTCILNVSLMNMEIHFLNLHPWDEFSLSLEKVSLFLLVLQLAACTNHLHK